MFWQHQGADGNTLTQADARKQLVRSGSKFVSGPGERKAILKALRADDLKH
jgi:hypothetical protein